MRGLALRYDLTSLEIFVAVAEEANLTRAAQRQHLALSAVSKRITELEELVEAPLFERLPRGVTLTPAGQSLLHYARQMLQLLQQMRGELSEYSAGVKGHIRIHATASALTQFLPAEIETFVKLHPMVRLEITEQIGAAIVRAVADGTTDIGIASGQPTPLGLAAFPYHMDRLVLAVPTGHALTRRKTVRFADTLKYTFVSHHADSSLWMLMSKAAQDCGKVIQQSIQVNNFDCMCRLVEAHMGVAMLPVGVVGHHVAAGGIRTVGLKDPWSRRQLSIVVRDPATLPFTTRTLIDHCAQG